MTEIHLFGDLGRLPLDVVPEEWGFIRTPTHHDLLDLYFSGVELKGKRVAIVYDDEEHEDDAGEIYDFMENMDAATEAFCDSHGALNYFKEWRPHILLASAAMLDLDVFLKSYREMGK